MILFAGTISASAQIKKIWECKIPEVQFFSTWDLDGFPRRSALHSPDGAILITINSFKTKSNHSLVWINSKGEKVYLWNSEELVQPSPTAVVTFNNDFIVSYDNIFQKGSLWIWTVEEGALKTKKTEVPHDFYISNDYGVELNFQTLTNNSTTFYGVDNIDGSLVVTKYRLETKYKEFWIQQSEDLENWRDLIQVPKGDSSKEFFRIAPDR